MKDSILIVDDEPGVLSALKRIFADESVEIYTAESGGRGLTILKDHKIKVVISDEQMPQMSGSEFLAEVKTGHADTIRIMLTGHASLESAMKAVNDGEIYRFFTKPWDDIELRFAVRAALEKFDLEEENRRLLETIKDQAFELKLLEKKHPGITKLERDERGCVVLDDISDDDIAELSARYNMKFRE